MVKVPAQDEWAGRPEFSVTLGTPSRDAHVVRIAGDLDRATASELDRFLQHLDRHVLLDCRALTFLDEGGLRVLLAASARLASFQMVNVAPFIRRVLVATHTTSLLGEDNA